jgi:alkyl hydroperoxide reductase subunit D
MPVTPPLSPDQAPEAAQKTLAQIKQAGDGEQIGTEYQMMAHAPAFLADAHANREKYVDEGTGALSEADREALALATSVANACKSCVRAHAKACEEAGWSQQEIAEIIAVASTGAMYNFFYKFRDAVDDERLSQIKPMLRAHTWRGTSLNTVLVELIAVLVSVVNSCHYCIDAHTKKAIEAGATHEQIEDAMRLAAVMTAYNTYFRSQ